MTKILAIFICIILCLSISACSTNKDNTCYNDWDSFYNAMAKNCVNFEKKYTYKTTLNLREFSFDKLRDAASEIDGVAGGCLYGITWHIENKNGYSEVDMTFKYYVNKSQYKKVCNIADDIARSMSGWTDYEKIKATHDFLIEINNYNIGSDGPYRALYKGQSNCNGYALSFMAIMRECGIPCTYETGDNHAWNSVMLDGKWYNIDVTWDDSGVWDKEGGTLYNCFLKNNSEWGDHHHGKATAEQSYNGDLTLKKDIKNYATIYTIRNIVLIVLGLTALCIGNHFYKKNNRKKEKLTSSTAFSNFNASQHSTNITNSHTIPNDDIVCGQ